MNEANDFQQWSDCLVEGEYFPKKSMWNVDLVLLLHLCHVAGRGKAMSGDDDCLLGEGDPGNAAWLPQVRLSTGSSKLQRRLPLHYASLL